jgi:hypothetical protein
MILSYSALNDYHVCPRRFWHKWIAKDLSREEKSQAQLDGTEAHEALRKRFAIREPLPDDLIRAEPICAALEALKGEQYTELKLGMRQDGKACDFFAEDCWLRGTIDLIIAKDKMAVLFDWKTGKEREDPHELTIQALLLRARWPGLERIRGYYVWLRSMKLGAQHDQIDDTKKTLAGVRRDAESIERRTRANDWPPDEGPLCGWCPVTREMCEF